MIGLWLLFRALRWLAWIAFFAFCIYFTLNRAPHVNSFGQLLPTTELMMFGTTLLAVAFGCFELMMREKANLSRPALGQLIPQRRTS